MSSNKTSVFLFIYISIRFFGIILLIWLIKDVENSNWYVFLKWTCIKKFLICEEIVNSKIWNLTFKCFLNGFKSQFFYFKNYKAWYSNLC